MNKTAFIDFDGTIVDVFPRYYGILIEYLGSIKYMPLDFPKYKTLKRLGYKDHIIVKELTRGQEIDVDDYYKFKRENLENLSWLKKDVLIGNPRSLNLQLKNIGYRVVLLTQRNNKNNLLKQLDILNIRDSFDDIIIVKPRAGQNVKADHIKKNYSPDDIIIGDSSVEIDASRILNISGYFVESGLFSAKSLGIDNLVFSDYNAVVDYIVSIKK
jgi:phosphoglycolate phosphatase-like HAD superfamily hydrolase